MTSFDIRSVPFSYRGSWFNLSPVVAPQLVSDDIHLVSHRGGMHPVMRFRVADSIIRATPSVLSWFSGEESSIDAVFDGPHRLRLRGSTLALIIEDGQDDAPFRGSFQYLDPLDGAVVFASQETGHRYRITVLAGERFRQEDASGRGAWRIAGDRWEIIIDEFGTAAAPVTRTDTFDQVVTRSGQAFAEYVQALAPWRSDRTPAAELATYVLWASTVAPYGFASRESILMSKHWMDRVWSWDHCFNALALAPGLPQEAIDQFEMPFDHQDPSGALPDLVGSSAASFVYVKPPIHGWALARLIRDLPQLDVDTSQRLLNRIATLTRFWLDFRRAPGHAVPFYLHGNDSGWDNSTVFLSGEPVESPDLSALLVTQLATMIDIGSALGDSRVPDWVEERAQLIAAIPERFWNGTQLVARSVADGAETGHSSLLRLIALVAVEDLPEEVTQSLIAELDTFLTDWGLATETPGSSFYQPDGYWRGPIWAPSTVLLIDGLRRAGRDELADTVSERFRRLCEQQGFAENFDALTGEGLRDLAYTWTASCYLLLAREHAQRADRNP